MRPDQATPPTPAVLAFAGFARLRRVTLAVAAMLGLLVGFAGAAAPAHAATGGGAAIAMSAQAQARGMIVRKITCLKGCSSINSARAGATLRFQGPLLTRGKRVVYLGGAGEADDVKAQLRLTGPSKARVATAVVPKRAKTGPVAIEITDGARSPASAAKIAFPEPVRATAAVPGNGPFFPIRGDYTFGTGAGVFGGASGRTHEGWDVFAKCGTPLVAAEGGTVLYKASHARAGNYVVIDVAGADRDEVYMHMAQPALVAQGATVAAGQPIGEVGDTGRASGCHLHFELWQGTWRSLGGKKGEPIDPLPTLKAWAAADKAKR